MQQIIAILSILLSFAVSAYADLNLLGQGTSTHGTYNLIYDTDLDITWYDFSNAPSSSYDDDEWQNQMDWADALSVTFGGNIYTSWRLPIVFDTSCTGKNCTNSEMGHLFYTELGNVGEIDIYGNPTGCGQTNGPSCLTNRGDFQNLRTPDYSRYWLGTEYSAYKAWDFILHNGAQNDASKTQNHRAIAVMDGMAVVPEPISSILFIAGAATLGIRRFIKKKPA